MPNVSVVWRRRRRLPVIVSMSDLIRGSISRSTSRPEQGRPRLPATSRAVHDSTNYVAPRNDVERRIAAIWQDAARGRYDGGIHDDFFTELSGSSLLAAQLVTRLRSLFQKELPLRRFFDAPTVAALAAALGEIASQRGCRDARGRLALRTGPMTESGLARSHCRRAGAGAGTRKTRPRFATARPPVFILAPPRSYTTLICAMLGQHPELYGLPELHLFIAERMKGRRATARQHPARTRRGASGRRALFRRADGRHRPAGNPLAAATSAREHRHGARSRRAARLAEARRREESEHYV